VPPGEGRTCETGPTSAGEAIAPEETEGATSTPAQQLRGHLDGLISLLAATGGVRERCHLAEGGRDMPRVIHDSLEN
jgi:hypothetical protein